MPWWPKILFPLVPYFEIEIVHLEKNKEFQSTIRTNLAHDWVLSIPNKQMTCLKAFEIFFPLVQSFFYLSTLSNHMVLRTSRL